MVAIWSLERICYKMEKPQNRCGSRVFRGASDVTRTRDLLITSEMHYRLCYTSRFNCQLIIAKSLGKVNRIFFAAGNRAGLWFFSLYEASAIKTGGKKASAGYVPYLKSHSYISAKEKPQSVLDWGFLWRSRRDLNPRYPFGVHTISSRARYDHFDTAPCCWRVPPTCI